ncbi:MAG TPA: ATP-binding protein [Puia sp.]|nr:ATP-binding protein [Puia sp.]
MTEKELSLFLKERFPKENEHCEWKAYTNLKNCVSGSSGDDMISYVSAISNMEGGHLIIGVENETLNILGIQNFHDYTKENLPGRLLGNCTHLVSENLRVDSLITSDTRKTIWILHIPKHSPRQPIIAHKKAWQRSGDSLIELTHSRKEAILSEPLFKRDDWSAEICIKAHLADLAPEAILKSRENFKIKNPRLAVEIDSWDDHLFLTKSKVLIDGHLTRTGILLLGRPESVVHLQPAIAQITWVLYDKDKTEKDYQHFTPPYIISIDEIFGKIRNLKYRYLKDETLFPDEVDQYDPQNIREALNNCIAHMDYTANGRITISEREDGYLSFVNPGIFLPGSVDNVINSENPPSYNRNALLAETMVAFNMIDSIGSGIKRMFKVQRERFFPMPDYELNDKKVKVTLTGKMLDMEYARILKNHPDLSLIEIVMLDKVQKRNELTDAEIKHLKSKNLIEGRKPNFHISAQMATRTEQKADYIKNRGFKDEHYKEMILQYIDEYGFASKEDIEHLILDLLPKILNDEQKENKVRNLIYAMSKRDQAIVNQGTNRNPKWVRNN